MADLMSIAFVCDGCDRPIALRIERPRAGIDCPACGRSHLLRVNEATITSGRIDRCLRCGLDRLYVQKDFNRKVGLGIFVLAAILSVPTWGLSLLAATLVDLTLYYVLGDVTICYGCGTQHRGCRRNPAHGAFDLHVAEAVDARGRAVAVGEGEQVTHR
ncbi:MAG TPA: hypothetical protein VFT43_06485 [Candidatus Polarisedimenticolia bacterium]|nr:hypothetical protein [Candidatus Polarisedimenticolia bacterium]